MAKKKTTAKSGDDLPLFADEPHEFTDSSAPPSNVVPQPGETIYIVDSHSLIFQVFHALPDMTSPRGEPVAAVYGFARDMLYLIEEKRPDYLLAAFDLSGKVFRHELFPDYKIERDEMPDDLRAQIPVIRELLSGLSIPILAVENYEADDILATVAQMADTADVDCIIVTSDKDCRQLITPRVKLFNIRKDEYMDAAGLYADWGVAPHQVVDFQALVGDKVDNVPGVPLIGPKIARELLERFHSLDDVLDNAHEVSGKKRKENLINYRDQAILSRELVRLKPDVELEVNWAASTIGDFDGAQLKKLATACGFKGMGDRLVRLAGAVPGIEQADWQADYSTLTQIADVVELCNRLRTCDQFCIDTETTSTSPRWAKLVGISIAIKPQEAFYLPVRAPVGEPTLNESELIELLTPILEDDAIGKVGQNLKYDAVIFRNMGIQLQGIAFDTMIASYLLEASARNHGMNDLSERLLGHTPIKIESLIGKGSKQITMDKVPLSQIGPYAAEDADIPLRIQPMLAEQLQEAELTQLNEEVELPLSMILAEMEFNGIAVQRDSLLELSHRYEERIEQLKIEIEELAGHPLNIASPKQLAVVLFDELKLPVIKKTKTGPSTDAEVLEELAPLHDLPAKIIEFRQFTKLKSTYVDALAELIHPDTGRVHASFNQVVAATGRLSSSDPNLQNIPVRTKEGREIRAAFIAGHKGWSLLKADYSQIELRVLAHYCGDPTMTAALSGDVDIHALVASEIHQVELDEVSAEMRRGAKAVNFGVIYGQSAFGLARSLGIEKSAAAEFIEAYFERFATVQQFMQETIAACSEQGGVKTILGRWREIRGIRNRNWLGDAGRKALRSLNVAERTAVNTVIQGSAADLIKLAMIQVAARLKVEEHPAKLLLQIHDELVFETPNEQVPQLAQLVAETMAQAMKLDVPLRVDVAAGSNWAECEPIQVEQA